jgi:hypothetical protein
LFTTFFHHFCPLAREPLRLCRFSQEIFFDVIIDSSGHILYPVAVDVVILSNFYKGLNRNGNRKVPLRFTLPATLHYPAHQQRRENHRRRTANTGGDLRERH